MRNSYRSFDRLDRVNEEIRLQLAIQIRDILLDVIDAVVTITKVDTSKDLAHAKVFITVFPDDKEKATLTSLFHQAKELRHRLAEHTRMHHVPQLSFVIDASEKHGQHIEDLLDSLKQ